MEIETEMPAEMDMETIDSNHSPSSSSAKHFGIKNAIQTNFGDEYVFQIAASQDSSTLAVSLSSKVIKLYSPVTGQYFGECKGHRETIHEISYSIPSSPNVICSCSSDATVRAWDTRTFKQILFWDWRSSKQVACLEESHMDDVTQVHFAPDQQSKLISSSVDGLLCLFDTNGQIDDDNHLESVMNVGTSIAKVGFFGQRNEKLWCLTHIETLSIWDWEDTRREVNFENARSLASDKWNLDDIDYFVDCYYSGTDDQLWVIGGTGSGTLGYFPINSNSPSTIGSPGAILEGGHLGVVRAVLPVSNMNGSLAQSKGIFGWTGGEDGRLCCWLSDESSQLNRSWITSALVVKSPRSRGKNRHHPY
ncbi:WD repeat-containing protein 89 homolog isoform X2 [Asparagus officinalis]|uniref:WD repeat-containing protein 89 homolog isoform X2 n=1 Tax=Asparagus officinalis TaxID=4686 RepID=UPI00098E67ED|nr:WD repeat-containing protein 89 homolog isoform X2 [Asparagus officinalis]